MTRQDFLELYSYAKDKGFLITIFTNVYSMTKRVVDYLKERPPFVIEITLNAISKSLFEFISQVEGSYDKTMEGLNLILERRLPLKIKTQVTKDNLEELPEIREFIEKLGLKFRPSPFLHARLDGDLAPCSLRIMPEEVVRLNEESHVSRNTSHLAGKSLQQIRYEDDVCYVKRDTPYSSLNNDLFSCAIGGGDGIYIDPYGNLIPCLCIREPRINLFEKTVQEAQKVILNWIRNKTFVTNSKCESCPIRALCYNCPGKALLEKGSLEESVEWFCELAQFTSHTTRNVSPATRHKLKVFKEFSVERET